MLIHNFGFVIQDFKGNIHSDIFAVKPKSSHPGDAHLLVVIHRGTGNLMPLVVHDMNLEDGSFFNGSYCSDMVEALAVFNRR